MWKKFKHFGSFWLLAKEKKFIKFVPEKIIVNQSSLSIRQAQVKDISAILLLERSLYQGKQPWNSLAFHTEISRNDSLYLVVLQTQCVIGLIGVHFDGSNAHITNLMVDSSWQKLGIGTYLIKKVIEIAKNKNCKELSLEVKDNNFTAQNLYYKLGFTVSFVWPNYYQSSHQDAFNMVLKLASD